MQYIYSWIPAYAEIVQRIRGYRNNQQDLIQVLIDIGVNVNEDEDRRGHKVPLSEIDPFTFLFFLGKTKNEWKKIKTHRRLCEHWNINVRVNDVCGIPSANPQKLWMFPWQYDRTNEINTLWDFFEQGLSEKITDTQFQAVKNIESVGWQKMTEGLFLIKPDRYLCLNSKVRPFIDKYGINTFFNSYTEYEQILSNIRAQIPLPFHEISFKGYINTSYAGRTPGYYRIGTTYGEGGESQLPYMLQNNIVTIGWEKIGSLYEIEPFNKTNIQAKLQATGHYVNDNRTASRKAGEIYVFFNHIAPGDYVIAANGSKAVAVGKVISSHYVFDSTLDFPHCRCVEWISTDVNNLTIDEGLRTTVWKLQDEKNIEAVKTFLQADGGTPATPTPPITGGVGKSNEEDFKPVNTTLNQILYGPPGTGKTFHSISYAVAIVENKEPEVVLKEDRKDVKAHFEESIESGNCVFTTFHQSLGYEDFIEGIKPVEPETEDDKLHYKVKDGIFKMLCTEAAFSYALLKTTKKVDEIVDFNSAYNSFIEDLTEKLLKGETPELESKTGGKIQIDSITEDKNIRIKLPNSDKLFMISRNRLSKLASAFPDLDAVTNIQKDFSKVVGTSNYSAYWATLNAVRLISEEEPNEQLNESDPNGYSYEYKKDVVRSLTENDFGVDNPNLFVLIIDEINRGNVSQVFGELITLIEEDKRLGKNEALRVILPYSQESFGVPPNVYIIGTMNTADRSVEALDTALRRRFAFIPMLPKEDELEVTTDGIDLPKILSTMNERLRVLKDNDHTIGHAWLWNVKDEDGLKKVFGDKILPLLQEYFYNDYEKLGLVLGNDFFKKQEQVKSKMFASFKGGTGLAGQYSDSWQYELKAAKELTIADFKTLEVLNNQAEPDEEE